MTIQLQIIPELSELSQRYPNLVQRSLQHEEFGVHYEHLVDLDTGEVTELYHLEPETLKKHIAREADHKPVDYRLKSFSCKLKSCQLLAKPFRRKILAHWPFVAFYLFSSFDLFSPQKGPVDL